MKPLLKWAGGKSWHVDAIRAVYRPGRRLVEPFAGGLAISLGLNAERVLANDINPHLMNFYRCVRDQYPFHQGHYNPARYYEYRGMFNGHSDTLSDGDMAELFYVLNHWCFNGLWRVNKRGDFNVPPRPKLRPLPAPDWRAYSALMNCWAFSSGDFETLRLDENDFLYCDPPYDGTFSSYDASPFGVPDHERLARLVSKHPGPACIMNADTAEMRALYRGFDLNVEAVEGNQRMQKSRGRTDKIGEIMAFNAQFAIDRSRPDRQDRQETLQ